MKNKLQDLNDHLFAQLERLSDEDCKGDELKSEIGRAKAVSGISRDIVQNASLALDAKKLQLEYGLQEMPLMIQEKTNV